MERNKTKEQLEEEKKISLSFRIKPLAIEGFNESKLREKAQELWELIVKLETEKYDLEERQKRQDYDVSHFTSLSSISKSPSSVFFLSVFVLLLPFWFAYVSVSWRLTDWIENSWFMMFLVGV